MNKGITLLILLVLLSAMGIVFYGNMEAEQPAPVAQRQALPQPPRETQLENLPMPPTPTAPTVVAGEQPRKTQVTPPQRATEPSPTTQAVLPTKRNATVPATAPTPSQSLPASHTQPQATAPQLQPSSQPVAQAVSPASTPKEEPAPKPAGTVATPALPQISPTAVQPPAQEPKKTAAAQAKALEATPAKTVKEEPVKKAESAKKETAFTVDEASLSATATHTMGGIQVEKSGKGFIVRITSTDSTFPFKVFQLPGPDRLIIDLPGTWKKAAAPQVPGGLVATGARIGNHPTGIRIVFDLAHPVKVTSRTRPNATTLELVLE